MTGAWSNSYKVDLSIKLNQKSSSAVMTNKPSTRKPIRRIKKASYAYKDARTQPDVWFSVTGPKGKCYLDSWACWTFYKRESIKQCVSLVSSSNLLQVICIAGKPVQNKQSRKSYLLSIAGHSVRNKQRKIFQYLFATYTEKGFVPLRVLVICRNSLSWLLSIGTFAESFPEYAMWPSLFQLSSHMILLLQF